jgi:hypothetical protein
MAPVAEPLDVRVPVATPTQAIVPVADPDDVRAPVAVPTQAMAPVASPVTGAAASGPTTCDTGPESRFGSCAGTR